MTKKLFRNIIITCAALAAAMVGGGYFLLKNTNPKEHLELVTPLIQRATGRDLIVAGDVLLGISLTPTVVISDARLTNAAWADQPNMVSMGKIEAKVSLWPLLKGELRFQQISVAGVQIEIERHADGRNNFTFPQSSPNGSTAMPLPTLHDMQFRDVKIRFRDGVTGKVHHLSFDTLSAHAEAGDAPLQLEFDGQYEKTKLRGEVSVAPYSGLLGSDPLALKFDLYGAAAEIHVRGQAVPTQGGVGSQIDVAISGSDLGAVTATAGLHAPTTESFDASFELTAPGPRKFQIRDIKINVDDSDLAGEVSFDLARTRPRISAALTSRQLRIGAPQASATEPSPKKPNDKLFSSDPIDTRVLKELDSDGTLRITKLMVENVTAEDVTATWKLETNRLRLHPLVAKITGGDVNGDLIVTHEDPNTAISLTAQGEALDLGLLSRQLTQTEMLHEGPTTIHADLRSSGASPADLAARLTGDLHVLVGEGRAQVELLNSFVGGATKLVGTMFSEESREAKMNCAAGNVRVKNGLMTSQVLLVDTEFATVYGKGTIDLGNELLDMEFKPEPKSATLNVAVPIEVTGPLSNPEFTPSKLATARKATGLLVLAGIVFPPAAIVGLGGLAGGAVVVGGLGEMGSSDNPCIELARGKTKNGSSSSPEKAKPKQSEGEALLEKTGDTVRDAVEGIGNTLKGLFGD